ncbi:sigma-70 family RNA polymerase sigma factor [Nocardia sp. SYP-A9097]|uniref:sigma-70 family RNA polymerase sigma factor n=1 Tax=Nocardia sp. SYP-A9097 TaxID=2663237 RepID=UPI0013239A39|nr:sigma-70 family RNA polymerase sigma factor [Nocardia sp. SYP-A9097]MRH87960.1 sigma-70 family RNA polymerase sigma factor [Nocardia sp. SYP-A9097]
MFSPEQAIADAHRREWALVLAATVRVTRDLDQAEECVQDAYANALTDWAANGVPAKPGAWLTTVARNRALNLLRSQSVLKRALPLLVSDDIDDDIADIAVERVDGVIRDDLLRLICTCCHPALAIEAQVALTLRLLCGLSTTEVAHAFLVSESTMAARITRAKKKIAAARIPYRVPGPAELPERIEAVLNVVHLLFTTGHTAPYSTELARRDLTERALDLARMLHGLFPDHPDVTGLLALILLTDARREARTDENGQLVRISEQDRSRWNSTQIGDSIALVQAALRKGPGRYALEAAIAAVHSEAPSYDRTDWREIVGLYTVLIQLWPSPVVALNRAVALGFADGAATGLAALDELAGEPQLAGYSYLAASRAHFLAELGRTDQARTAYQEAILLTGNAIERDFLTAKLRELD